jgi:hypothetical protein
MSTEPNQGGIEATAGGIVASGPAGVAAYDLISFRAALRLEILSKHGMVMRRGFSIVNAAIRRGYVTEGTRSKRKAYEQIDALCVKVTGLPSRPLPAKGAK